MPANRIGAFEAKTRLSQILEQVSRGRTFVITRRGRPIAELRPAGAEGSRLKFGCDKGAVIIGKDFDEPIPDLGEYSK